MIFVLYTYFMANTGGHSFACAPSRPNFWSPCQTHHILIICARASEFSARCFWTTIYKGPSRAPIEERITPATREICFMGAGSGKCAEQQSLTGWLQCVYYKDAIEERAERRRRWLLGLELCLTTGTRDA